MSFEKMFNRALSFERYSHSKTRENSSLILSIFGAYPAMSDDEIETYDSFENIRREVVNINILILHLREAFIHGNCRFFEFLVELPIAKECGYSFREILQNIPEELYNLNPCLRRVGRLYNSSSVRLYSFCGIINLHTHC